MTDFEKYFSDQLFDDLRVRINPLAPGKVIDQYLSRDGRVTAIRLIQFNVPDDIASLYQNKKDAIKDVYTEFIIHAKAKKKLPIFGRLTEFLEERRKASDLVEIHGIEPNIVKLNIEFQGRPRTIDLGNINEMRAYYDITDEVKTGANGHPVFESIDAIARELLGELNVLLGNK